MKTIFFAVLCSTCSWIALFAASPLKNHQYIFHSNHDIDELRGKSQNHLPTVFLISIDGLRFDYITHAEQYNISIPNIKKLMSLGSYADVISVYPALTFPAHTTMITGVNPSHHGIYQNDKFDPMNEGKGLFMFAKDVNVPTLFDIAKRNGIYSSAITWPVTAFSDSITYSLPDAPSRTPVEFDYYYNGCIKSQLFRNILDSQMKVRNINDYTRLNLTITLINEAISNNIIIPRLNALHLVDFDHAEHVHGPFSKEAIKVLEKEDEYIGQLLYTLDSNGLSDKSHIFVVSDHGFGKITTIIRPGVLFSSLGVFGNDSENWKASPYVAPGIYAIFINDDLEEHEKTNIQIRINHIIQYFQENASIYGIERTIVGFDEVKKANLGGYPGAYALIEAKENYWFSSETVGLIMEHKIIEGYQGTHGYNPEKTNMRATFIAKGPSIAVNKNLGTIKMVDFAPTIAHILGMNMENVDGHILNELFLP